MQQIIVIPVYSGTIQIKRRMKVQKHKRHNKEQLKYNEGLENFNHCFY